MKYYGVDRGSPFTDSNYSTLAQHSVKTIIVDTFINDSSNSSSARWSNIKSLAAKYNYNYVIWPDQGGDVSGCGWEDPFNSPVNGNYIGRVTTMLDSFASDSHFIGLVSAHEPMWNVSTCKTSIPDLVAIKSQLKSYMTAKGRADFKVWAYIDNITDLANMSGYVPQDIQDVMDVAVTWQHCFGGAEGSCAGAKNKIIADRALINKAGLDGKVDLVYLFQTFGMGSGSGYTMPTLSDMQAWDCQFIATNALDGFMYYTWGAWYNTDLINHPELWPEMNRVYELVYSALMPESHDASEKQDRAGGNRRPYPVFPFFSPFLLGTIILRSCRMIGRDRRAVSDRLESGARKCRYCACEHIGSAFRLIRVDRIRFEGWRFRELCSFDCRRDQGRHDALLAITAPNIKARERPYGISSTRSKDRALSSHGKSSRGVSWHQPTARSPSKASKPGGGPRFTILRNALRFFSRGRLWYSLPILQYMHQQPLLAPPLPNKSSRAGHRSGVSGRIVSCIQPLFSFSIGTSVFVNSP